MVIRREAPKGYSAVVDSQREDSQDDTWRTLMPAPKSGDHLSYERLLHDILPFVRNLARRHCRRRQDREEAVQEKFLTVYRVRHTYDPDRPFSPEAPVANLFAATPELHSSISALAICQCYAQW